MTAGRPKRKEIKERRHSRGSKPEETNPLIHPSKAKIVLNPWIKMGRVYLEHMGGQKLFNCGRCGTFLTNRNELMSTRFTGATGRAFLFTKVVNLKYRLVSHLMTEWAWLIYLAIFVDLLFNFHRC